MKLVSEVGVGVIAAGVAKVCYVLMYLHFLFVCVLVFIADFHYQSFCEHSRNFA